MADTSNMEKGEYIIGIAIIIAALLVSATVWITSGNVVKAISAINITTAPAATAAAAQQPAAQQQAAAADWSFVPNMPGVGPKDAKVTVIAFADFQCPFCGISFGKDLGGANYDPIRGTATKIENEYANGGKSVRFVYVPMAFLGQESVDAANAAFCAKEIGGDEGFFTMHDALFTAQGSENSGVFSKDNLKKIGAAAGFNSTAFTSCVDTGKYYTAVQQATADANQAGVSGTPTFAVNNKIVTNGAEYTYLKAAVDAALK
ncbi:MAG: DsbA family protein [Candidatus Micrarchaeota archaeon]|nr:DsbA family protein [Candidatus Micrarchaeota archaeon]